MGVSEDYLVYVLDQMGALEGVAARRMFGGAGLYWRGVMIGLVADDVLYFKVDEGSRGSTRRGRWGRSNRSGRRSTR